MFPYNLQNYNPFNQKKIDPVEPIPERILSKAKAVKAQCISKDGKIAYKETSRGIEQAFAPNFESWWYDANAELPNDTIWFDD